jgi:hypothetical protein
MTEFKTRILHINLARGWRGGEQQTWLLIKELAKRGYQQGLCAYPEDPIAAAIRELEGVEVISPSVCLLTPWRLQHWDIVHAHEGRGVYLAWWLKQTRHLRYIITRRMQQPPKSRFLTRQAYNQKPHAGVYRPLFRTALLYGYLRVILIICQIRRLSRKYEKTWGWGQGKHSLGMQGL